MRYFLVAIVCLSLFTANACSSKDSPKPEMKRCQEELNTIPEVAASLKSRNKQPEEAGDALAGMEIALTINRMVRSTPDPNRDRDDWCYIENTYENFDKLLKALRDNGIPPTVDFLEGESLDLALQEEWLRSGNLIGDLTFRGVSPKKGSAQDFIDTLSKIEQELSPLWGKFERKHKYFRYPALKLGVDSERPREIRAYLKQNSFIEVPATIDSRDDYFSQPYCAALNRDHKVCANYISATFKSMMLDRTVRARAAAQKIVGRDIKQILMIQANQLTCDFLDELLRWYKALGVRFISLEDALSDPFYAAEDVTNNASQIIWETKRGQGVMKGE